MSKGNNDNEPKCRMRSINNIGRGGVQAVHVCACFIIRNHGTKHLGCAPESVEKYEPSKYRGNNLKDIVR
ncbi:hypothetical protein PV328_006171, partial [Microctonus aethiopoides]